MRQVSILHYSVQDHRFSLHVAHDDKDSSTVAYPSPEWLHDYNQWFRSHQMNNFTNLAEIRQFNEDGVRLTKRLAYELRHEHDVQVSPFVPVFSKIAIVGGDCVDAHYGFPICLQSLPVSNQIKEDFKQWKQQHANPGNKSEESNNSELEQRLMDELNKDSRTPSNIGIAAIMTIDILVYDAPNHTLLDHPRILNSSHDIALPSNEWMEQYKNWNQKGQHLIANGWDSLVNLAKFNQEGLILRDTLQNELGIDDILVTFTPVLGSIQVGCTWWHIRDGHYRIPLNIQKLPVSNALKSDFSLWNHQTSSNARWLQEGCAARIYERGRCLEQRLRIELHHRCNLSSFPRAMSCNSDDHHDVQGNGNSSQEHPHKMVFGKAGDALAQLLKCPSVKDKGPKSRRHRRMCSW